jgi:nucleoside-diphosphate-sugar epimerase
VRKEGVPEALAGLDVEIVRGDVTRPDTLGPAVAGVDEVYHLAGALTGLKSRDLFAVNAAGTANLLAAASREGGLRRFVLCSSLSVSGPCEDGAPVSEDGAPRPLTWYGESKALAERIAAGWSRRGMPITVVRPPVVYGPRDRGLLSAFQAVALGVRPVLGSRRKTLSWVYGPDLAEGLVAIARADATVGRTYFAAHPETASLDVFLRLAAEALGKPSVQIRLPESLLAIVASVSDLAAQATGRPAMLTRNKMREVRPSAWVCRTDAAFADAGWRATTPLSVGVPETARWYRDHGWLGRRFRPKDAPTTAAPASAR